MQLLLLGFEDLPELQCDSAPSQSLPDVSLWLLG